VRPRRLGEQMKDRADAALALGAEAMAAAVREVCCHIL
jgi:hypothetical protein